LVHTGAPPYGPSDTACAHTHCVQLFLSLSLTHTHTHAHCVQLVSLTHARARTHTHSLSLFRAPVSAERKTSLGKDWHAACLKCGECNKKLNPGAHAEVRGDPTAKAPSHTHTGAHTHACIATFTHVRTATAPTHRATDRHSPRGTHRGTQIHFACTTHTRTHTRQDVCLDSLCQ
jgi:hypothetical protein